MIGSSDLAQRNRERKNRKIETENRQKKTASFDVPSEQAQNRQKKTASFDVPSEQAQNRQKKTASCSIGTSADLPSFT